MHLTPNAFYRPSNFHTTNAFRIAHVSLCTYRLQPFRIQMQMANAFRNSDAFYSHAFLFSPAIPTSERRCIRVRQVYNANTHQDVQCTSTFKYLNAEHQCTPEYPRIQEHKRIPQYQRIETTNEFHSTTHVQSTNALQSTTAICFASQGIPEQQCIPKCQHIPEHQCIPEHQHLPEQQSLCCYQCQCIQRWGLNANGAADPTKTNGVSCRTPVVS